jgi:hypothetical protein
MRWFGILLIVVNLLAGAGFLYLATQDWKGRQSITAMGVRHILLLRGLPVEPPPGAPPDGFAPDDETPFVVEMGGGDSTKTISKKLLESYFAANTSAASAPVAVAPGAEPATAAPKVPLAVNTPVTNQVAEVKRVQGVIEAALAKDGLRPADKLELLRGWLLFQAENYDTRREYQKLLALKDEAGVEKTPAQLKDDADKLKKILDARFAAALTRPQVSESPFVTPALGPDGAPVPTTDTDKLAKSTEWRGGTPLDDTQRRMNIAHLLVHLDPDAAWQKRVMVVVGLRRYVKALTLQVARFTDMTAQVEGYIANDQAAFAREETGLREKATQNAERAKAVAELRAAGVEKKTEADDAVSRESTQLTALTAQLTKLKGEVDELLVRQTGLEAQLFEIQREVALTLEEVYRLELLLDATERERFGLPPQPKP